MPKIASLERIHFADIHTDNRIVLSIEKIAVEKCRAMRRFGVIMMAPCENGS
jgi:hypothetical protein